VLYRRFTLLIAALALFAAACGDDGGQTIDSGDTTVAPDTTDSTDATDDATATVSGVDYEIFSSDEGAGCGVFVSVPEDAVDGVDARTLLWSGVVAQEFTTCGFSDVVEAGLITVNGLDEYNQPDWSNVVEHAYFGVAGWDDLVADCFDSAISSDCAAALEASLTE
jgi:hypothetical protein